MALYPTLNNIQGRRHLENTQTGVSRPRLDRFATNFVQLHTAHSRVSGGLNSTRWKVKDGSWHIDHTTVTGDQNHTFGKIRDGGGRHFGFEFLTLSQSSTKFGFGTPIQNEMPSKNRNEK